MDLDSFGWVLLHAVCVETKKTLMIQLSIVIHDWTQARPARKARTKKMFCSSEIAFRRLQNENKSIPTGGGGGGGEANVWNLFLAWSKDRYLNPYAPSNWTFFEIWQMCAYIVTSAQYKSTLCTFCAYFLTDWVQWWKSRLDSSIYKFPYN